MAQPPDPTRRDQNPTRLDGVPDPTRRDLDPTRREPTLDPTQREAVPSDTATLLRLPADLARRYRVRRELPTQGAEADLLLIEPLAGGEPVVCKLYRRGVQPNTEVLRRISATNPEHVVRLLEHGSSEGRSFEIMEWIAQGSLRDLLQKGPLPQARVRQLLTQLQAALQSLHAQHILHRDLKPENLLIRSLDPLRLVLTDFGIASVAEATLHFTSAHRTLRYAAPEAAAGAVSPASDYWSLGMILAESLAGRHPFAGLTEPVIQYQLNTQAVPLEGLDESWRTLCRGLLVRDPKRRWGGAEIARWLAGDRTLQVPDEAVAPSESGTPRATHPYRLQKQECWTGVELAARLAQHWTDGVAHLSRRYINPWLLQELHDQDGACLLDNLLEDRQLTPDQRLLRLIRHLDPQQPPIWKGMSLAEADLAALAQRALQGEVESRNALEEIWQRRVLQILGEGGHPASIGLQNRWGRAVQDYDQGWKQIIGKGVPSNLRPDLPTLLPALLLAVMDESFAQGLCTQARQPPGKEATVCPWFSALGGLDIRLSALVLIVIQLLPAATECGREALRKEAVEAERLAIEQAAEQLRKQDARRKLIVRSILGLAVLLTVPFYIHRQEQDLYRKEQAHQKQAEQEKRQQELTRLMEEKLSQTMVAVKGGTFKIGSPETEKGRFLDEQQHIVWRVQDFSIAKYEVTQAQWRAVVGDNPSSNQGCDDCPVENVSWNDVQGFIHKLNARTGKTYRLPTEAEWEYACRSGGQVELYCGGADLDRLAWHKGNSDRKTHPVGQKAPNGLGLHDMSGNVSEWTCSAYDSWYKGDETKCSDKNDATVQRVARGGGSGFPPDAVRSATRYRDTPDFRDNFHLGFRLAQDKIP